MNTEENKEKEPYFQGKVDTFCAIYATINGFDLCSEVSGGLARRILNENIYKLADDKAYLLQVLNMETDYVDLVDSIIQHNKANLAIQSHKLLFNNESDLPLEEFWRRLSIWQSQSPKHTAIFRFLRFLPFSDQAYIRHWTTSKSIDSEKITLYDCSLEATRTRQIYKNNLLCEHPKEKTEKECIYIQQNSVRLLAPLL